MTTLRKDLNKTLPANLILNSENQLVEDQGIQYTNVRADKNALSAELFNNYKDLLENITDRLGDVETNFQDQNNTTQSLTVGSKIREIVTDINSLSVNSISTDTISNMFNDGIYKNTELGLFPYSSDITTLPNASQFIDRTLPDSDTANTNVPIMIEGSIQDKYIELNISSGTVIGKRSIFSTSSVPTKYTKLFLQACAPTLLDLDTTTLNNRTFPTVQQYNTSDFTTQSEYTDSAGNTISGIAGYYELKEGYNLPAINNFTHSNQNTTIFGAFGTGTNVFTVETYGNNNQHIVFNYENKNYRSYELLLADLISQEQKEFRKIKTRLYIQSEPTDTLVLKYAYHKERWLGLAVLGNSLVLKYYKNDNTRANNEYNLTTDNTERNPLYDEYLPQLVGQSKKVQLIEGHQLTIDGTTFDEKDGTILYDFYINPLYIYNLNNSNLSKREKIPYYERRIKYISGGLYSSNDGNYNAFGSNAIGKALNHSITNPLCNVSRVSIVSNPQSTNRSVKVFEYFELSNKLDSSLENELINRTYDIAPSNTNDYLSAFDENNYIGIKITKETSNTIDSDFNIQANIVIKGAQYSNINIPIPNSKTIIDYIGYEPNDLYLFLAYRIIDTTLYIGTFFNSTMNDSAVDTENTISIDNNSQYGSGIKSHHITGSSIMGSASNYSIVDPITNISGELENKKSNTQIGTLNKINHIIPKSIGTIEIQDQSLTERMFPGNNNVGNNDHRLSARNILKLNSISKALIESQTDADKIDGDNISTASNLSITSLNLSGTGSIIGANNALELGTSSSNKGELQFNSDGEFQTNDKNFNVNNAKFKSIGVNNGLELGTSSSNKGELKFNSDGELETNNNVINVKNSKFKSFGSNNGLELGISSLNKVELKYNTSGELETNDKNFNVNNAKFKSIGVNNALELGTSNTDKVELKYNTSGELETNDKNFNVNNAKFKSIGANSGLEITNLHTDSFGSLVERKATINVIDNGDFAMDKPLQVPTIGLHDPISNNIGSLFYRSTNLISEFKAFSHDFNLNNGKFKSIGANNGLELGTSSVNKGELKYNTSGELETNDKNFNVNNAKFKSIGANNGIEIGASTTSKAEIKFFNNFSTTSANITNAGKVLAVVADNGLAVYGTNFYQNGRPNGNKNSESHQYQFKNVYCRTVYATYDRHDALTESFNLNDYADTRPLSEKYKNIPGKAYIQTKEGLTLPTKRCQKGITGLSSDTYGMLIGNLHKQVPIGVSGWVLAYCDKEYEIGTPLTNDKNGNLTKMKWWEKLLFPERLLATFDSIETKKKMKMSDGSRECIVDGRYWVKVK